jgi:hypothetical protein
MSEIEIGTAPVDRQVYVDNRSKFMPEDLLPYAGQWVAWSADGSRIVAHNADLGQVVREVERAGLQRDEVVFDHLFIEKEGEALL